MNPSTPGNPPVGDSPVGDSPVAGDADKALHEAWNAWCDALREAGDRILRDDFPADPADRAEGFRHLAEQAVCWTTWGLATGTTDFPRFMRQNDLFTQWGGPNHDNVYKHTRVDPAGTYRVRGRMHSCEEFLLAVRIGNMHQPEHGTLHEVTASDLGIGPGDEFEIIIGGPERDGRWVPLPDGARMIAIREYYYDWQADEPATFTIERLDGPARPGRVTPDQVAAGLHQAREQFTSSITYWNDYMLGARARGDDNTFIQPRREPKGLKGLVYAFCFYRLAPGEALVVECEQPVARYWSFQLYNLAWFEATEYVHGTGGLNHRHIEPDPDGRVRVVLSAEDPGVPNWLDTQGRTEGMLTFRCAWADNHPQPVAKVVPLADVTTHLPPGVRRVDAAERAEAIAARAAHARWRFRV